MSAYNDALLWATSYCSRSEHCAADVLSKIDKYELNPSQTEQLLAYLKQEKYIDEKRYARAYALDQFRFAQWGRLKIAQALRMKHIHDSDIQDALQEIPQDEYLDVLKNLLLKKQKQMSAKTPYELTMKLLRFAYSRGFEPEHIRQCMTISDDF